MGVLVRVEAGGVGGGVGGLIEVGGEEVPVVEADLENLVVGDLGDVDEVLEAGEEGDGVGGGLEGFQVSLWCVCVCVCVSVSPL